MSNYTELHCHTYYSALDGLNSPEEYLARANELGMSHLAITDHGTLAGHRDFQAAAKSAGIIPILGLEAISLPLIDLTSVPPPSATTVHQSITTSFYWLRMRLASRQSTDYQRRHGPRATTSSPAWIPNFYSLTMRVSSSCQAASRE